MNKVVVTGSAGFIGKYLVSALKGSGYQVVEVDYANGHDLTNPECLKFISDFDYIIHLASRSFVPESFENPFVFYKDNYLMTLNVLEAARKAQAKVIFFSSYLYGTPQYLPIDEKHPLNPHNPYAQSKLICEKLCEGYNRDFGLDIVVFRPFNIYGNGQNLSFLIPSILKQTEGGIIRLKDPRPKRDFIHLEDVVTAILRSIDIKVLGFEVLNLGTGQSYSVEEIVSIIVKFSNEKPVVSYLNEYRKNEVLDAKADITRIQKVLSWSPQIPITVGLKQIVESIND